LHNINHNLHELYELLVDMTSEQKNFIESIKQAMRAYFGADARRVAHADAVAGYASELLACIDADPVLTLAAAYLHDIGIHEAERRHGSSAGNFQELEGPPIARQLLVQLGATPELIDQVARIVGLHHTSNGVDAPEFRILWDADALVNFVEVLPGKPPAEVEQILSRHMVTEPGYRMACQRFLTAST
jgi:HD superfamily phosphodiesterase